MILWRVVAALSMSLRVIGDDFSTGDGAGGEPPVSDHRVW